MSKLTGTYSETAEYEFTTLTTVPGTLTVHGAPSAYIRFSTPTPQLIAIPLVQILDLREDYQPEYLELPLRRSPPIQPES